MTNQTALRIGKETILSRVVLTLLLGLCSLFLTAPQRAQETDEEARRLPNKQFQAAREAAAAKLKAARPATTSRTRKAPPAEVVAETGGAGLIGVTFWRLSPAGNERPNLPAAKDAQSEPKLMIPTAGGKTRPYRAARVSDDETFSNGDLLSLGIEVPRVAGGYVYVIDREEYDDGTLSEPYLIFPGAKTPVGANLASAGKLVRAPAQGDPLRYFELKRSGTNHVGERLTIIVSPRPLALNGRLKRFDGGVELRILDTAQVEKWEQQWSGQTQRLNARGTVGKSMSIEEQEATGQKQLLPTDGPLPQTIYGVNAKLGSPVLVSVSLKIAANKISATSKDDKPELISEGTALSTFRAFSHGFEDEPKLILEKGHSFPVRTVAFSPDGRLLASGSHDRTIKIWDAVVRRELRTMVGHTGAVNCLAFSPDGSVLVSGSDDKTIKVWDVKTGEILRTLTGLQKEVLRVAISPNGRIIASAGELRVKLWDSETGQPLADLGNAVRYRIGNLGEDNPKPIGHTSLVDAIAFSPDGKMLVSGGLDSKIILWDIATGKLIQAIPIRSPEEVKAIIDHSSTLKDPTLNYYSKRVNALWKTF